MKISALSGLDFSANNSTDISQQIKTPSKIVNHLDRFVKGQGKTKQAIAVALYNHALFVACRQNSEIAQVLGNDLSFNLQHLLLIGETGCGKSYLLQKATEYMDFGCSFFSATSLVQTGYHGMNINRMIQAHYHKCSDDLSKTQRSIIFIDEIDKVRRHFNAGEKDVAGECVQNSLLTLLDGKAITIFDGGEDRGKGPIEIDSRGILLICAGSFAAGLSDIIRTRLELEDYQGSLKSADLLACAKTEDLVRFGIIPEFIGRFNNLAVLDALTTNDLVSIMSEKEDSALQKHKNLFAIHGVDLVFTPEALKAIASQALDLQTGARGLNRVLQDCLLNWEYQLPELAAAGVTQIEFNEYGLWEEQPRVTYGQCSKQSKLTQIRQKAIYQAQAGCILDSGSSSGISNTRGWSNTQIKAKIDEVKSKIDWEDTSGSARTWWLAFERENQSRLPILLRLAEELLIRQATITEFFLAFTYSNTDNIQANLFYLDYSRLKKKEDKEKRSKRSKSS